MNNSSNLTGTTGTGSGSGSASASASATAAGYSYGYTPVAATKPPLLSITDSDNNTTLPKRPKHHRSHHKEHSSSQSSKRSSGSKGSKASKSSDHHPSPRVVLGPGAIGRLPNELGRLHASSPLIVSSPSRVALAKKIQALIPNLSSRILDSALVQVPSRVIDDTISRITGRDCVISVGGGSAVNLARAIGLRKGIPHICIPTTYSGSELVTHTASGREHKKSSLRESKIPPTVVIYDEDLTMSSPKRFSAPSAAIAMASTSESRPRPKEDGALWSYLHLPGV